MILFILAQFQGKVQTNLTAGQSFLFFRVCLRGFGGGCGIGGLHLSQLLGGGFGIGLGGVDLFGLGENDKVMVLARTDHDDEAQTESIEADTEDEPTAEQLAEMEAADEASAAEAPEADTGDEE